MVYLPTMLAHRADNLDPQRGKGLGSVEPTGWEGHLMRIHKPVISAMVAIVVALALGASGCAGSSAKSTPPSGQQVVLSGFVFDPDVLTVKAGDTVVFTNEDSVPHEVKIDGKVLGPQQKGASVTWKAEKAGSYPYSCTVHPSMVGTIVVR